MRREEAGLGFLSRLVPLCPSRRHLFPAPCPKGTHHYGTNHGAFDHPPQRSAVIHIPAAERQRERAEVMLRDRALQDHVSGPGWCFPGSSPRRDGWKERSRVPRAFPQQGLQPKSQGHHRASGQRPPSPFTPRTLGGEGGASTSLFLPSLKGNRCSALAQEQSGALSHAPSHCLLAEVWPSGPTCGRCRAQWVPSLVSLVWGR